MVILIIFSGIQAVYILISISVPSKISLIPRLICTKRANFAAGI